MDNLWIKSYQRLYKLHSDYSLIVLSVTHTHTHTEYIYLTFFPFPPFVTDMSQQATGLSLFAKFCWMLLYIAWTELSPLLLHNLNPFLMSTFHYLASLPSAIPTSQCLRNHKILPAEHTIGMSLEDIIPSELSQHHKGKCCRIPFIWSTQNIQTHKSAEWW